MSEPMSFRLAIAVVGIGLVGCVNREPEEIGLPPDELHSPDLSKVDEPFKEITQTFEIFDAVATFVSTAPTLEVYEGLPHDVWELEQYEAERKRSDIKEIDGIAYYARPVYAKPDAIERLRRIMSRRSSFVPFRGIKPCGGFHADWCLVWQNGDKTYNAQLCFGCDEMMVYHDGKRVLYCDIWNIETLKTILEPLHINRPKAK